MVGDHSVGVHKLALPDKTAQSGTLGVAIEKRRDITIIKLTISQTRFSCTCEFLFTKTPIFKIRLQKAALLTYYNNFYSLFKILLPIL